MDIKNMFKNGQNDGNITIKAKDNETIRAHSLFLKECSPFFKACLNFKRQKLNDSSERKILNLEEYNAKHIIIIINKFYNSDYKITITLIDDIFILTKLINYLQIMSIENFKKELKEIFLPLLNHNNWFNSLEKTYELDIYSYLRNTIKDFILDTVLGADKFFNNNILINIDKNTPAANYIFRIMLSKIGTLNTKLNKFNKFMVAKNGISTVNQTSFKS